MCSYYLRAATIKISFIEFHMQLLFNWGGGGSLNMVYNLVRCESTKLPWHAKNNNLGEYCWKLVHGKKPGSEPYLISDEGNELADVLQWRSQDFANGGA